MINTAAVGINGAVETIKIILKPVDFRFKASYDLFPIIFLQISHKKNTFSYTGNDGIKKKAFFMANGQDFYPEAA